MGQCSPEPAIRSALGTRWSQGNCCINIAAVRLLRRIGVPAVVRAADGSIHVINNRPVAVQPIDKRFTSVTLMEH
jgi:hypothetical protein